MDGDRVIVFKDEAGEYRWHRKAANNEIISDSGEGYADLPGARSAAERANPDLEVGVTIIDGDVGDGSPVA